ncbi:MAG: SH3 domain-containing protein [Lachnospiraceae bacterium]
MRHSRRRVMKEHMDLYIRKHVFNGRYFKRNMQIVMCFVLVVALTIGCFTVGGFVTTKQDAEKQIDVKEALFGSTNPTERKTEKQTDNVTEVTENTEILQDTEAYTSEEAVYAMEETTEPEVETTQEEPSLFDDRCIANVEDELNIRKEPDSEAEFVGSMESGAIAIVEGTEGEWTKIKSGDVEGYVLTQYILTGEVAAAFAKDYVILHGTVLEDGVNIRSEKSTTSDIVTILDKDDVVTVLENPNEKEEVSPHVVEKTEDSDTPGNDAEEVEDAENTEDVVWLTVRLEDGQEGYVSADYVDIDELYQIAVSKEELERQAAEEEARRQAEEEARRQAEEEAARRNRQNNRTNNTTNRGNSNSGTSYQGNSINPITATQAGESLGMFTITAYCGCSRCSSGNNRTASGTVPTQGRTIAADTSILPFGTQVVIGGVVYTVEDCGSGVRGNHIDIFFATHEQALAFGRRTMQVFRY